MSATTSGRTFGAGPDLSDEVCLSFPADPSLFLLARMTGSAIANQAGFNVEDIADLRLAIDELCTSCSEGGGAKSTIELCFTWSPGMVRVTCTAGPIDPPPRGAIADPDLLSQAELSERIIAALVDEYRLDPSGERTCSGYLVKFRDGSRA